MRRRTSSASIRSQITWVFTAITILVLFFFGLLTFYLFERTLTQVSTDHVSQMINKLNQITDNYIAYMEDIASVVLKQQDINDFIAREGQPDREDSAFIGSIIEIRGDIVNIILKMDDDKFLTDNPDDRLNNTIILEDEQWFRSASRINSYSSISSSHVQNIIAGDYPWVISLVRMIAPEADRSGGVLLVDLNYNVIRELCSGIQFGQKGYIFIVNRKGEIVYHPRQDLIYNDLKHEHIDRLLLEKEGSFITVVDDAEILYTFSRAKLTGWTAVGVSYTDELFTSRSELLFFLSAIIIISFIFIVILASIISARITKPIEELRASMKQVEQGNFNIDITVECEHEVYDLAVDCDIAIKKIAELITQIEIEQELKRKNELKALQAQINPHFLYNTLDSIIWLTEGGRNDDAVQMTEELANFFRLSLSKGKEIIPIRLVMEHISSYLSIQKMRYKNTLDYKIMVNPAIYKLHLKTAAAASG